MRPAVILLALLSAAALMWSHAIALKIPRTVTVSIEIFDGKEFRKLDKYQVIRSDVFKEADAMLKKFTDYTKTTFTFSRMISETWDDRGVVFTFEDLEKISEASTMKDINMYVFFANNQGYRGEIRNRGLKGGMCFYDHKYRTLMLNQYDLEGRNQTVTSQARILVYYIGILLGMNADKRTTACPSGFMDSKNWGRTDRQTWNICNVRDLASNYKKYFGRGISELCVGPLKLQWGRLYRFTDAMNV